jgi:Kef-type K+ transport system membrane component KefB
VPETRTPSILSSGATRAYCKIVGVAILLGIVLGVLITYVDRETVNGVRHHLTLWLVIAIVAIINIVSFLLFALFYMIYRWIKRDLDPDGED